MIIDHIGLAVRSLEDGIKHWSEVFGYRQMTEIVVNTRQQVRGVFLEKEGSLTVKLIEPTGKESPIFGFSQRGGGLHHLCFKCDKLSEEIDRLTGIGMRILSGPQPGEAFENEDIAFVYVNQGLNVELIDTDKRAGIIRY